MQLKQSSLQNEGSIKIPTRLPLLESLCWNIENPYSLSLEEMLGIYEERWRFKGVLGELEPTEHRFIKNIVAQFRGLPLVEMNDKKSKKAVFAGIKRITDQINTNLFNQHRVVLGGGALVGMLYKQLRYSSDLDFLVPPQDYNALGYRLRQGESIFTSTNDLEIGKPRIDKYGIRYPIRFNQDNQEITIKLEIVAEWNMAIAEPGLVNNIPCLNLTDLVTAKLLANVDRGHDRSKFSRDLIDLAIIGSQTKIPSSAIDKAKSIYPDAITCLKETVEKFQNTPEYRERCYENLQIDHPEIIVNGIDYLAKKCALKPTERTYKETDFSYLDPGPKSTSSSKKLTEDER
ncbi:MAG: nucleotidyl transferase AbiEii/AbiGii toxin family protein [Waterburya sp.]